jgi:hypothetical protein
MPRSSRNEDLSAISTALTTILEQYYSQNSEQRTSLLREAASQLGRLGIQLDPTEPIWNVQFDACKDSTDPRPRIREAQRWLWEHQRKSTEFYLKDIELFTHQFRRQEIPIGEWRVANDNGEDYLKFSPSYFPRYHLRREDTPELSATLETCLYFGGRSVQINAKKARLGHVNDFFIPATTVGLDKEACDRVHNETIEMSNAMSSLMRQNPDFKVYSKNIKKNDVQTSARLLDSLSQEAMASLRPGWEKKGWKITEERLQRPRVFRQDWWADREEGQSSRTMRSFTVGTGQQDVGQSSTDLGSEEAQTKKGSGSEPRGSVSRGTSNNP